MGHTMPASIDGGTISSLLETFCLGVKALGITNGAAKGDIKLSAKGLMIGEVAARLSGGYMSGWTYPYSCGILPTKGAIEIALGRKMSRQKAEWNWTCAERAFISIPGKLRSVTGIEKAGAMPWVKDVFMRVKPGSSLFFPENNVSKCGNIISAAPGREEATASAEKAARSILMRLEAPNEATDAFLAEVPLPGVKAFPPDAFTIDQRLQALLQKDDSRLFESEFAESGLKDYVGRTVKESFDAVSALSGLEQPFFKNAPYLDCSFWKAFVRGGYQGAVYYIDSRISLAKAQ
jgi:hypothetical protein